jgi:hypothetical protein
MKFSSAQIEGNSGYHNEPRKEEVRENMPLISHSRTLEVVSSIKFGI